MSEPSLGLFAKCPRPGQVKTRLAEAASPEWAARVAAAFLADTVERMAAIAARRFLVHAPDEATPDLVALAQDRFELAPQGPGDLGERLMRFLEARLASGPVVVIGADSPTLPPSFVEFAFFMLSGCDVVLGPATDGGYYLLGCRRLLPSLFSGIDWGGPHVLRQTVERLAGPDASLVVLQPWYDVDTLDDWHMLVGHLAAERRAGADPHVPHTEALIREGLP